MVKYVVSPYQCSRNRLKIEATFPCDTDAMTLYMSAWRPGRYEEGNFTRFITHLQIYDDKSQRRTVEKTGKNTWEVETKGTTSITVTYLYVAKDFNAGSTFYDENILLLNPVNALIYHDIDYASGIELHLETSWQNYGYAAENSSPYFAEDFDQLFDQPIIGANQVKTLSYTVNESRFYLHLWSMPDMPEERIIADFKAFTTLQIQDFGGFPVQEFHFLLLGTPQPFLHGVEHLNSTVIVLGPNAEFSETFYFRLLSVASHELYHVWNIKTLRPKEMLPYRYQDLNYSKLGYIYEGVTTYLGDLYLLRSGSITSEKYLSVLAELIQRHIENPGRYAYSVADSSVDTWVDGYVPGVPGRKVSIYNEGALIAFMLDVRLRDNSNSKVRLETMMRDLYVSFGKKLKGYTQEDILTTLSELSTERFEPFFQRYVFQANGYESGLVDALERLGLEMKLLPPTSKFTGSTGIRVMAKQSEWVVHSLAEGSPGYMAGLCEDDVILKLNGHEFTQEIANSFFEREQIEEAVLTVRRNHVALDKILPLVQRTFYPKVELHKMATEHKRVLKNQHLFGI